MRITKIFNLYLIFQINIVVGGSKMKKVVKALAAIAMLATASASMGCIWFFADEPKGLKSFK